MSRSGLSPEFLTAVDQPHVTMFLLLELYLDGGTQYLASTPHDVVWSGQTYTAAQGIGTIEPTAETDSEARGLTFTLSAAGSDNLAGAFEEVQGRAVILRLAIVDESTAPPTLRVDPNAWSGTLDVTTIDDNPASPVIRVTAEHSMLAWQQPPGQLFSHQEQQAIDPTDLFFEHAAAIAEATLVWPDKSFFRQ
jgi:hypothetical protein